MIVSRLIVLGIVCLALFPINVHASLPTSGSTLFFDDFLSQSLGSGWTYANLGGAVGLQTNGGWLSLASLSSSNTGGVSEIILNNTASQTPAFISNQTPNGSLINIIYKIQPFNLTNLNAPSSFYGNMLFGFADNASSCFGANFPTCATPHVKTPSNWFGFLLRYRTYQSTLTKGGLSAINLVMDRPSTDAVKCFGTLATTCTANNANEASDNATRYDSTIPIDFTIPHIFQITTRINRVTGSWVAFSVDDNAIMNYTQAACLCIGTQFYNLYPFIEAYFTWSAINPARVSTALFVDYVLITDYLPTSLPSGQLLSSGANPPTTLVQPGVTGSLPQFIQFEANSIAPGNIYAGGMMLFGLIGFIMFSVMGITAKRTGTSLRTFGFFYSIMCLGLAFFGFYCQVLPVMIPVTLAIVVFAISFGVIRTGQASGGVVPD